MTLDLYPYEQHIIEAEEMGLTVREKKYDSGLNGLNIDDIIFINRSLSLTEKNCVLLEEIGHAIYNVGDITSHSTVGEIKLEKRARNYAYTSLAPIEKIVEAYKIGCRCLCEVAEYLTVTEQFLVDALEYYRNHMGLATEIDGYVIKFCETGMNIWNSEESNDAFNDND